MWEIAEEVSMNCMAFIHYFMQINGQLHKETRSMQ